MSELNVTPIQKTTSYFFKKITKETLPQIVLASIYLTVTLPFAANPITGVLLTASFVASIALTYFFKSFAIAIQSCPELSEKKGKWFAKVSCILPFALFDNLTRHLLMHEVGHYAAGSALFTNGKAATITVNVGSGFVRWPKNVGKTTRLAQKLANPRFWVTAAGPLIGVIIGTGLIISGYLLKNKFPTYSAYATTIGVFDLLTEASYCAMDLFSATRVPNNDFAKLAAMGCPHWLSLTVILTPIVALVAVKSISSLAKSLSKKWCNARSSTAASSATLAQPLLMPNATPSFLIAR